MKPAPINPHAALLKVVLSGRNDVDAVIAGMVRRKVARRVFERQADDWIGRWIWRTTYEWSGLTVDELHAPNKGSAVK